VRRLSETRAASREAPAFDATASAAAFWRKHIDNAATDAIRIEQLVTQLREDAEGAGKLGRRAGMGANPVYVVRGIGRVTKVDASAISVDIGMDEAEVIIRHGPIFGNALRDAFDSAEVSALNSFEANALSSELNRLAEDRVQPQASQLAKPGARLQFVGCAQRRAARDGGDTFVVVATHVEPAS
jgi:predicted lipoprotein